MALNLMTLNIVRVLAVLLTAVAMSAGMAHLFALPNKIDLPETEYFIVQQIYRGWSLAGIALIGALIANVGLAFLVRHSPWQFYPALLAAGCIMLSLVIFFAVTESANRQTLYWTVVPENWQALRSRWEYSHAVGAVLHLIALVAVSISIVSAPQVQNEPLSARA